MIVPVPNGYAEVLKLYGDPVSFLDDHGMPTPFWTLRMTRVPFPSPLPLGWNPSAFAKSATVHSKIADELAQVFARLVQEGLWARHIKTFDGAYTWRTQRGSTSKLSMHSFGAAVDFNAATNQLGSVPMDPPDLKAALPPGRADMSPEVVRVFESCGWTWGGRFHRPDPMHFQYAKGV